MLELNFHETKNGLLRDFLYADTKQELKDMIANLIAMGFKKGQKDKNGIIHFSLENKRVELNLPIEKNDW